jgi:hypothetical protein
MTRRGLTSIALATLSSTVVLSAEEAQTLPRQARTLAQRNGEPLLEADVETLAGMWLEELRSGPHQEEEARYWQANLLFARVSEQAGHPPPAVQPGLALAHRSGACAVGLSHRAGPSPYLY